MKVIIAGSRTISDYYRIMETIVDSEFEITEVVSGGASGVDECGEMYASAFNLPLCKFPANWPKYGKSAGMIRNEEMAKYADALILVWDGKSKGSAGMKRIAERYNLLVFERILSE